jgi:hypothetical protein
VRPVETAIEIHRYRRQWGSPYEEATRTNGAQRQSSSRVGSVSSTTPIRSARPAASSRATSRASPSRQARRKVTLSIPPKAGPSVPRLPRRLRECGWYRGGARSSLMCTHGRGMRPLRDRRCSMAAVRLLLQGLLDGARAVHDAGRREALRVERHERARRRAGGVVCRIAAALCCRARPLRRRRRAA